MSCAAHELARRGGMMCEADVDLIRETMAKLPPESVVIDLGAGFGTSALSVLAERSDIELVTIDCHQPNLDALRATLGNANVPLGRWRGVHGDSALRGGELSIPVGDIGLIIVDTTHERDDTVAEIEAWLPKLAPGGYMLFHDYDAKDCHNYYPGVQQAVDPFLEMGRLDCVKRQGWSLLARKAASK